MLCAPVLSMPVFCNHKAPQHDTLVCEPSAAVLSTTAHPPAAWCVCAAVSSGPSDSPAVQQLVQEVLTELLAGAKDIQAYAAAYSKQHGGSSSSLRQQAAAVEMAALLDPTSRAAGVQQLLAAGAAGNGSSSQQLQDCIEVHKQLLSGPLSDAAAAGEWRQQSAKAFPHSSYFGGAAATAAERLKLNPAELKQPLPA